MKPLPEHNANSNPSERKVTVLSDRNGIRTDKTSFCNGWSLPSMPCEMESFSVFRPFFSLCKRLYGLEACPLTKSDLQSLDFVINRFFTKLFTTKSIETVKYCQEYFDFSLPSVLWAKRVAKFEVSFDRFCLCYNCLISFVLLIVCCLPCLLGE